MSSRADVLQALRPIADANHISLDGAIPPQARAADYVHPDNGGVLLAVNVVLASVTMLVVLARFWTRCFVAGGMGGDDITAGAAMLVVIAGTALNYYGVRNGVGKHFYDLEIGEVLALLKFTYYMPMVYSFGVIWIKVSILLFYRRLFGDRTRLQKIVLYFLVFQVLFALASICTFAFVCSPVRAWWSVELHAHRCPTLRQTMRLYTTLRAVTVACDIGVLCLPMKMVYSLKIPPKQRAGLAMLFALGLLACIVAITRLALLPRLLLTIDVSWNVLPIVLLDQTEQCLGIITASIPALTAWLSRPYRVRHGPDDQGPRGDPYDFLSFAYDPDRQNMGCYATAYSEHVYVLDDLLGGAGDKNGDSTERLNLGVITTTTTVTVDISRKSA